MKKILLVTILLTWISVNLQAEVKKMAVEEAFPKWKTECDNGNLKSCGLLSSVSYVSSEYHDVDYVKSRMYAKKACSGNNPDPEGCFYLGLAWLDTRSGVPHVDTFKAHDLYKKGCDLGGHSGCFSLARCYEKGKGAKINPKKAVDLYNKAIKLGSDAAYINLGIMTYNGIGVKRDVKKAKEMFGKACDAKIQMGCDLLAEVSQR